ncbi:glycosyltransferase family 2 protein [Niveispirillum sp.]|uniref:glycosyltransferase family 2 protein n=1 Tax=Niveispirillum sp. TaxID=1917217 RepID=UPI001B610542|nr:glycosyltransferase family 2 protein [Niveispirillum sp.]MBP7335247.1 glycosyltransferase family 2 protein [Niveispirillum sp.]
MIRGNFDCIAGRDVCGWAWDSEQPHEPVPVTVLFDNVVVAQGLANHHRPDLQAAGIGQGIHAFYIALPEDLIDGRTGILTVTAGNGHNLTGSPASIRLPNNRFRPVPPPPVAPPLTLAVCAIVKDERPYLLEWIAHHRLVGVQHFVLFDNGSTDQTTALLSGLARAGIVDHVPWPDIPHVAPQIPAYIAGLARLSNRCRWVAFIDADEFLNPIDGRDVPSVLADHDGAAGLVVPWRLFGSNGRQQHEDDLVISRFTRRAAADHPLNRSVKTIVQARLVARPDIHVPTITDGTLIDEHGRVAGSQGHPSHHAVPDAKALVINHYFTKSQEEWVRKRSRGRATEPAHSTARLRPDEHFLSHDINDIEDAGLAIRADRVRAEMERLASLLA